MQVPFVSRGRYEDAVKRSEALSDELREMKLEKEKLLDRISVLSGQQPIYAPPVVIAAPSFVNTPGAAVEEPVEVVERPRTFDQIRSWAERKAKLGARQIYAVPRQVQSPVAAVAPISEGTNG